MQNSSVPRGDRATPAEAVVDAGLDGMLVVPETGADDLGGSTGEGGAAKIVILVLGLGGPVRREHVFQTGANSVAVLMTSIGAKGHRCAADADADIVVVAPGVAALAVEQRRTPGVSEPAGGRAKLVVVGGDQGATREQDAIAIGAKPAVLAFSTDQPVRRELVFETALQTTQKPTVA